MENPIKIDDLGVPLFSETPICPFKSSLYIVILLQKKVKNYNNVNVNTL